MASQAVYHALKAPSDPPQPGGHLKIHIASTAWDNKSLYMPNKGEVIGEWVLTKLLKDRANPPSTNSILDPRFWTLLSKILSDGGQTKSVKHWLIPLLNRIPFAPIITSFLQLFSSIETGLRLELASAVNKSLATIWPLAVHKISVEVLLECFGTILGVWKESSKPDNTFDQSCVWIISSLRTSVENSSNKKKLSSLFTQNHLRSWIYCSSGHAPSGFRDSIFAVGVEILFNVDTLRQVYDEDHQLFVTLRNIPDDLVHPILPRIFTSFLHCLRKYRSALFGQGASQNPTDHVRETGFTFFDSCQVLLNQGSSTVLAWSARLGLLEVVREENMFGGNQLGDHNSLQKIIPLALSVLGSDCNGDNAEQASLAIGCLSKLMEIDHDLVLPHVLRILPELLRIGNPFPPMFAFLELLLDYHVKTRTIHTHIENLFTTLSPLSPGKRSSDEDIRHVYRLSSSSALLHRAHLERLGQNARTFLTSNQTVNIVRFIFEHLQGCWNQIVAAVDSDEAEKNRLALAFSFGSRLAYVVLCALPKSLPATAVRDVHGILNEMRDIFFTRALMKTLKTIGKSEGDSWASQVVAAAILRLEYALETEHSEKMWTKLIAALDHQSLLPELSLEIFRILLKWSVVTRDPIDRILDYLEQTPDLSDISWSGTSSSLTLDSEGKAESALALLHMLIERWLPTIDAIASRQQLGRLVKVILTSKVGVPSPHKLDATSLLLNAFSSAQFWELPNLRVAILAFAEEATSTLTDPKSSISADACLDILSTYQLLLLFPIEYISRTTRTELVRRAVNADFICSSLTENEAVYPALTVIRVFIQNVAVYLGSIDQPISTLSRYLNHLIHNNPSPQMPPDYRSVTLSLVDLHFSTLLKSSEPSSKEATLDLLRSCLPPDVLRSVNECRILVRLIDILIKGYFLSNFAEEVQLEISTLHRRLLSALLSHVTDINTLFANEELMNSWLRVLSLGRWLKLSSDGIPLLGRRLCSRVNDAGLTPQLDQSDGHRITAFAILAEELQWLTNPERQSQLGLVLAAYISFARQSRPQGLSQLDQLLSQTCAVLSATDFCHLLDLTSECLSDTKHPASDAPNLVHLAALLLSEHPAGTLNHTQKFLTTCMNLFVGHAELTMGSVDLRVEVLRLVRQQCSDRPASLRTLDIGSIWLLLSKFLAKSNEHDIQTSVHVFHEITVIIGALVRLRRDLVALTLPHLGMVLQQLIMTIRAPRPQLGTKQHTLVADTLPRWVNAECPVGPEEAKALARLLETLNTKTTIRSHSSTSEQRAESLARPFSKHAAYIIKAYIDAMNDPLCILTSDIRKELRPGLFALCNMLNEHSRDAMMLSGLDAGGKTIMKHLWTEYEKQKYVGKG
ncbi:Urb2/Npa2 family-domain-containing protein [Mycena rebaudengoi]|nr:Urb2/Npa2 family-domain-containing protein [Mycena rebaudengoi]